MDERHPEAEATRLHRISVLALALVIAALLIGHVPGINGPWYWEWPFRRLDAGRVLLPMTIAFAPFVLAQVLHARGRLGHAGALALLALATLALEAVSIGVQGPRFNLMRVALVVENPIITSYFTDALGYSGLSDWLGSYPERMREFHLHSFNKPPGPVLYYAWFLHWFEPHQAALFGGLVVGLLASGCGPATFALVRLLGAPADSAFHAASYAALCPGLILFYPEFDQTFPLLCAALLGTWVMALERDRGRWSACFGAVLALVAFTSYSLLVLGAFAFGYAVLFCALDPRRPARLSVVARHAAIGLATTSCLYALFYAVTAFDPFATFVAAVENQARHAATLGRPWPATIPFDLLDFALGTGWLSFLLIGFGLARWRGRKLAKLDWVVLLCIAQVMLVAVGGLIPVETARVWLFMIPLFMLPVGLELSRWGFGGRMMVYVCLWGLMVLTCLNLGFLTA